MKAIILNTIKYTFFLPFLVVATILYLFICVVAFLSVLIYVEEMEEDTFLSAPIFVEEMEEDIKETMTKIWRPFK